MAPRKRSAMVRKSTSEVMISLNHKHDKACMFCNRKEINEMLYGFLYKLDDVIVHYFCILLSSQADQNGSDKEGIWGFLLKDIKAELLRGSREKCYYCKNFGATISCSSPKCLKTFHLPCGLKNGSMHQYFQRFKSFCQQHRVTQTVDLQELQYSNPIECIICKEDVLPTPLPTSLWAPCCKRNAWFHRKCIQSLALSSGYFFKCPLCCNVDKFKSRMLTLGIYIPSSSRYLKKYNRRDASWETVPNAYAELLERHGTCDSEICLCPHSEERRFHTDSGSWEMVLCYACGSNGTHRLCSSLKCNDLWYCSFCKDIAENPVAKKRRIETTTHDVASNGVNNNGVTNNNNVISNNVTNNYEAGNSTLTLPEEIPSTSRLRPRSTRNRVIRESLPVNTNNEKPSRPKRVLRKKEAPDNLVTLNDLNRSLPQQLSGDIIIISDSDHESDNDSDVQVLTYIEQAKETITPNQPNLKNRQMPVISSYTSISSNDTVVVNNSINIINPRIQTMCNYSPRSSEIVDLTSD